MTDQNCLVCGEAEQDCTCPSRPVDREANKRRAGIVMAIGFVMLLGGVIPMAVGQTLPVFIACAVLALAGAGVMSLGKKMGDR